MLRRSAAYGIGTVGAVGLIGCVDDGADQPEAVPQENGPQADDPIDLFRLIHSEVE